MFQTFIQSSPLDTALNFAEATFGFFISAVNYAWGDKKAFSDWADETSRTFLQKELADTIDPATEHAIELSIDRLFE